MDRVFFLPEVGFVCKFVVVTLSTGFDEETFGNCSVGVLAKVVVPNKSSFNVCRTSWIEDSNTGVASPPLCEDCLFVAVAFTEIDESSTELVNTVLVLVGAIVVVVLVGLILVGITDTDVDICDDEFVTSDETEDVEELTIDAANILSELTVLVVDEGTTDVYLLIFEVLFSLFFSKLVISLS